MAKNLTGRAVDNLLLSEVSDPVGTIAQSELSEMEYNAENLGVWYLLDGRSSAGTLYATKSENANVPNALIDGAFLRQAKVGRTPGTFEEDDNKSHNHTVGGGWSGANVNVVSVQGDGENLSRNVPTSTVGGTEARPKNIAVNFYIKVGY